MKENLLKHIKKYKYLYFFLIIVIISILLIILKNNNPEKVGFFPPCLVYKFTGIKCAGCGMTRAMYNLLNFNVVKAFTFNPLLFVFIMYFVYALLKYMILSNKRKKVKFNDYTFSLCILLVITMLYMIFRNIYDF